VIAATGTGARIEVPLEGQDFVTGETMVAAVRRDRIAVRRAAGGEVRRDLINSVAGEIHAIENQGSYVKVTIDLGDGEEFVANVLDEDYFVDPIDIGDRAVASWSAGDMRLLEDRPSGQSPPAARRNVVAA
jgi:putative spermidine/putrescine transport system ATP-binding protein